MIYVIYKVITNSDTTEEYYWGSTDDPIKLATMCHNLGKMGVDIKILPFNSYAEMLQYRNEVN